MGLLLRSVLWLWPLLLWLAARHIGASLADQTPYWRTAQAAGPLLLALAAAGLWKSGVWSKRAAALFSAGAVLSGILGLMAERARWLPWLATPGTSLGTMIPHLDWPLLLVSAACLASPLLLVTGLMGRATRTPFGQARWMRMREALKRFSSGSLVIGEAYEPARNPRLGGRAPLLRFDGSGHLLTVAGSGSGKTVSVAIPNALTWEHNLVVHDPKGEIHRATAQARRGRGRRVVLLDPGDSRSDVLNVLSWLDPSRDAVVEDARAVASWLLPPASGGGEARGSTDFFRQSALNLLEMLVLHTVCDPDLPPERRTLRNVRTCLDGNMLEATIVRIQELGTDYAWGAAFSRASQFARMAEDASAQLAGVVGEADNATSWLAVPSLAKLVSGSGGNVLRLGDLADSTVDVFICVSLKTLDSSPQVARVLLGALLNAVYEQGRRAHRPDRRTLFLIDEMPRLRKMELLETARDAGRGLGVTLWSIAQDIGQLKSAYGEAGVVSWMENSQVRQFFGVSDLGTAEMLSRTLGQQTIAYETSGSNRSHAGDGLAGMSSGESRSGALTGKPLLSADEIMRMCTDEAGVPDEQIVLVRNQLPLRCGLAKFHRREEWRALMAPE